MIIFIVITISIILLLILLINVDLTIFFDYKDTISKKIQVYVCCFKVINIGDTKVKSKKPNSKINNKSKNDIEKRNTIEKSPIDKFNYYKQFYVRFKKDIRVILNYILTRLIKFKFLNINSTFGVGDAALTGEIYGIVCPILYNIVALLSNQKLLEAHNIILNPDFNNSIFSLKTSIKIRTRIFKILKLGLMFLILYCKYKVYNKKMSKGADYE